MKKLVFYVSLKNYIPVHDVEIGGILILVISILGLTYQFWQWRKVSPPNFSRDARSLLGTRRLAQTFFSELVNRVILQRDIIVDSKFRLFAHLAVFWGFIGTGIATTLLYVFGTPDDFLPSRLFGNGGGFLLLLGGTIILGRLAFIKNFRQRRTFTDLLFLILLYITTITGFATEYGVFYTAAGIANPIYIIHLAVVTLLLATAPFTSFVHAILTPALRYLDNVQKMLGVEISKRVGVKINYKHWAATQQMSGTIKNHWEHEVKKPDSSGQEKE